MEDLMKGHLIPPLAKVSQSKSQAEAFTGVMFVFCCVTQVQGTNDSSVVSKVSAAAQGYFHDVFLQHFVCKVARRAPLINRSAGILIMSCSIVHWIQW